VAPGAIHDRDAREIASQPSVVERRVAAGALDADALRSPVAVANEHCRGVLFDDHLPLRRDDYDAWRFRWPRGCRATHECE
jgi:hypothetical protein